MDATVQASFAMGHGSSSERRALERKRNRPALVFCFGLGLIACAVVRSAIATRLDDLNLDEPYHITAGISYVRLHDFRINPEHPPLVKICVGLVFAGPRFQLSSLRRFVDKNDERDFTADQVFLKNDPDWVQRRARAAMLILNAGLLFIVFLAVRRTFADDVFAIGALAFLVIDPTVAGHMPVVLTDLPLALLSITTILCASIAFRTWRLWDLLLTSLVLGLVLAVKHSGLVTAAAVTGLGAIFAMIMPTDHGNRERARRLSCVALVLVGAVVILWCFYLFRFRESLGPGEYFNRPLAVKISDVRSPLYRDVLRGAAIAHLLPRAYIWGLADAIRAGAEGRADSIYFFGKRYYSRAPFYFFPAVLAVKIPVGLIVLVSIGLYLLITRNIARPWLMPIGGSVGFAVLLLVVLASGSSYAGVRHALPVVPVLALCAALAIHKTITNASVVFRVAVPVAFALALVSAIPVVRPWEYYNEFIGGSANGFRYFNDEGLDVFLRGRELAQYYHEHLEPFGEVPYITYAVSRQEKLRRGIHWVGEDPLRDRGRLESAVWSGTIIMGGAGVAPRLWWDRAVFRNSTPASRFGNLFVFRGSFPAQELKAQVLYYRALDDYIYTSQPNLKSAQQLLSESVALDPKAFFAAIELGNVEAQLGDRSSAITAYSLASKYALTEEDRVLLARQIARVSTESPEAVPPLRNPEVE
jgi:hypothetical protein